MESPNGVQTMNLSEAERHFSRVVDTVARHQRRILVEKNGVPVVAIISAEDLERLNQYDAEWEEGLEVFDRIAAAFADASPEEIERETARALAEVRAEMSVEQELATRT